MMNRHAIRLGCTDGDDPRWDKAQCELHARQTGLWAPPGGRAPGWFSLGLVSFLAA